jgi:hypothetical protein
VRAPAVVARTRHARATRAVPPFRILEVCMRSDLPIPAIDLRPSYIFAHRAGLSAALHEGATAAGSRVITGDNEIQWKSLRRWKPRTGHASRRENIEHHSS